MADATKIVDHNEKDWKEPPKPAPDQLKDHPALSRPVGAAPEPENRKPTALDATLNLPGTARNSWEVYVDHTHKPIDLLDPTYWSNFAADVQPGDYLDVEPFDGSWFCKLRVNEVDKLAGLVLVEPVGDVVKFSRPNPPRGFKIEFSGSKAAGWRVLREDGNKLLRGGFASYMGGYNYLAGYRTTEKN